jgi:hypothetical protein
VLLQTRGKKVVKSQWRIVAVTFVVPSNVADLRSGPVYALKFFRSCAAGFAEALFIQTRRAIVAKNNIREDAMAATRIDCDIHPAIGGTRTTLLPYLDDHWKEQVVSRAIDGLDLTSYPP